MRRELNTVDLFCGAGGATTGMELALSQLGLVHKGIAINHWQVAVDTMTANHPAVDTKRMSIEEAIPAELVPGGEVDLLWASPSCTHFSRALGGKPRSNQLRAQPELVLTWLDQLFVRRIIIENVPEFVKWGPLNRNGRPIKAKEGACFVKWVEAIEARNYYVEWRVVNCADYGDATSRRRFFLKAVRKGCGRICWPEPTHAENPEPDLWGHTLQKWRGVRECLDLSDTGRSIFGRKEPLAANTLRRIAVGMKKYNGIEFQMDMLGSDKGDESRVRPLTSPLPPQHAGGNRTAVVRPFLVKLNNHATVEDTEEPLTTVTTSGNHHALCQPFIVRANRGCFAESVDAPLSSQQASTVHHALCQPFLITEQANNAPRSLDEPLRAQTTVRKDYVCQPFIVNNNAHNVPRPLDKPAPALTTGNHAMLCQPRIVDHFKHGEATAGEKPIGAQTTHDRYSVATPFIVEHHRNGTANATEEPLGAQTTKDKFSVVTPLIIGQHGGASARPIDKPCPTIATGGAVRVATPIVLDMSRPGGHDSGHVHSADEPMQTLTSCDALQVATPVLVDDVDVSHLPRLPDGRYLDIRLRMLKPSELAAAHSFPKDYVLTGNRTEQVKQIGNSVPVMTAAAMCEADLRAIA